MEGILTLDNVSYRYEGAKAQVLKGVNAVFEMGKLYAIVGKSGAGKSTLLSLLSGLDLATGGEITYKGEAMSKADRDAYRAKGVGVVFQSYNLLTNATALQNIVLSMNISGSPEYDKKGFAYALLSRMGIDRETADRKVLRLSGGEQQRVGIARAMASDPPVLIADEPTGNLDKDTEEAILSAFSSLAREEGKCVIIVSHSRKVAAIADVVFGIADGAMTELRKPKA
ncbi:MAG: ATP-binding cassette domain-containing protein [Oscillospiraceae bacterium]|nr:ATP-binding cassette domain-containing protein [Oscillospiraceae bacterium]